MSTDKTPFAARRESLLQSIGEGVAVIPAAPVYLRNNDVEHAYRQDSDFWYLTGFEEPDSVLVLTNVHGEHRSVLFVPPRNPDREIWDGPRAGVEGALAEYGVDAAFSIEELDAILPDYLLGATRLHCRVGRGHPFDEVIFRAIESARTKTRRVGTKTPCEIVDIEASLHEMRMVKAADEIAAMDAAAAVTAIAHRRAMEFARPGMHEYEVEAEMDRIFRSMGSPRTAYDSIVGSGPNATVLHYRTNRRRIEDGDLLLIDAGCELGYYASDVTRTFPVGRRFSEPQKRLYEIVLAAQEASIALVKPGVTLDEIHDVTLRVLTEGLVETGLIQESVEESLKSGSYKKFYMHRTSHWIGMDVHDVGAYFEGGDPRPLKPGFVLTIEPGLYVAKDAEVEEQWRGIGIRIEDDILVTASGYRNLSEAIPKTVADIEALTSPS